MVILVLMSSEVSVLFYGVSSKGLNHDYIVNDILKSYKNVEYDFVQTGQERGLNKLYDVVVYNCSDPNRLSYWGYSPSYEQIKQAVTELRPKVVIQLADEWAIEHNEVHNLLANYCNLFLRQYRHRSQLEFYPDNLEAIPLGYLNGYIRDTSLIKPSSDRRYMWSWVGRLKLDRAEMLTKFWAMWNNLVITNSDITQAELYKIYSDSVFVPGGRGNSSLDCWRLCEATVAGAIPVVVGSEEEIDHTFRFFDNLPPWVYAQDWDSAVRKCQEVQFNPDRLNEMQANNVNWWERTMGSIRISVVRALNQDRPDVSDVDVSDKEKSIPPPVSAVTYC